MVNTKQTGHYDAGEPSIMKDNDILILYKENHELKMKIEQLEARVANRFDIEHVKAIVQPFSGDDALGVKTWLAKLEDAFRVLNVGKTEQLVTGCHLLTGTAEVFRRINKFEDYDDFKTKLQEEFFASNSNGGNEAIKKQLRSKKLKHTDQIHRYVLEMVEISMGSNISEVDLVDIIIDGLNDNHYEVAMLYGAKTIAELKKLLPRYKMRRLMVR
uniref:Retrotransposon gag domain-containing protein n=1 Tax=Anopheles dirus TaxID=7168 RepID=A0A182NXF1_9DIPT